jgi:hypothetical protein
MPGSPPTKIAEAGTRPPPKTRSNSSNPDFVRGGGASFVAKSVSSIDDPRFEPSDFFAGPDVESPVSWVIVFHSPQLSHRPDHFVEDAAQAEHVNVVVDFAMTTLVPQDAGSVKT